VNGRSFTPHEGVKNILDPETFMASEWGGAQSLDILKMGRLPSYNHVGRVWGGPLKRRQDAGVLGNVSN